MAGLSDLLEGLGTVLDYPGSMVRSLLAGQPGQQTSGRDLLEKWGILDQKSEEGFDAGDVAGMGAGVATDPLTYLGGALIKGLMGARKGALASNASREALLAKGAMPEEVAQLTKVVGPEGKPLRVYHGTGQVFDKYDLARSSPDAGIGKGVWTTDSPAMASNFASKGSNPNVRMHFLDVRNPLGMDEPVTEALAAKLAGKEIDPRQLAKPMYGETPTVESMLTRLETEGHDPQAMLKRAGIDALTHRGEPLVPHLAGNVQVVFDPKQVYAPFLAPAARRVPGRSPLLAALGGVGAEQGLARSQG